MSIADQVRQEARIEKATAIAKAMFKEGASFDFVKRMTELSDDILKQLQGPQHA